MESKALAGIEAYLKDQPTRPPIEQWQPDLSGDIAIVIKPDGSWWHEGGEIQRQPLLRLFASILRREDDGEYYLITPVEKWRIQVEAQPLIATDYQCITEQGQSVFVFTLNTGLKYALSKQYPLQVPSNEEGEPVPQLLLDRGLSARLSRSCYYRLVDEAQLEGDDAFIESSGERFSLAG
ncbi:DUF1285 domain-containing protein [Dasania sp. GY-MA-18]|uniref:DUF1285 domain-containing protein n=1 Tax=Dasania phycosphaerae TaxID=2950436 RepID=A0A9J6RJ06_9GAMM|nr:MULTISPECIES: DUF1285 domain-containing protein [Dasania]MCR8921925.1 DUF1285 domain-containing protein [Dasania sp. GY-MA-18]MCZ0864353.1 DUF1285 domain-containing protein [Dasania phycosphaerae]MCZ0868081.1 DUF1285 domain-containing protein [Dasania phycosphaerae]